ncbi:MAG: helix-turn-helix domain-containing protein [Phocaeicola dorei]|uniref:helix-turn-helix domain-containing protein n=1 Tax=Phocaeicola dorei TaxID=357276 RepID=UPI00234C93DB|nr:helix-turn-helix domain-containing protein [Phocaeicola dorei]MCD8251799.1 helix-turn-helix domain-containing protein [Phocaeicola dorei]MDC7172090.1 helix-turn-helix domain-containing protein [Phocaeicola dorei]
MKTKNETIFICQEMDGMLKQRVDYLVKISLINQRKRWIADYIEKNFTKFMGEDRLLTSDEVVEMLQISHQTLGRRIKQGKLLPVNPEAKRNYRFKRSDVYKLIEKKGE